MRLGDTVYHILAQNGDTKVPGDLRHFGKSLADLGFEIWPSVEEVLAGKAHCAFVNTADKLIKGSLASHSWTSGWIHQEPGKNSYTFVVPFENSDLLKFAEEYQPVPVNP